MYFNKEQYAQMAVLIGDEVDRRLSLSIIKTTDNVEAVDKKIEMQKSLTMISSILNTIIGKIMTVPSDELEEDIDNI